MKRINLFIVFLVSYHAFAYDFKCDFEIKNSADPSKLTLLSENENIHTNFDGHDIGIQFAHRQEIPYTSDYYSFRIFGPDTAPYVFQGKIIQDCGFGTQSIQITCTPIE